MLVFNILVVLVIARRERARPNTHSPGVRARSISSGSHFASARDEFIEVKVQDCLNQVSRLIEALSVTFPQVTVY